MIFAIDSGLDLTVTMLALSGIVGAALGAAVRHSPSRPRWRSFVGTGALVAAAFVLVSTLGAEIELRIAAGVPLSYGSQRLAWATSALLVLVGGLLLRFKADPVWLTGPSLSTREIAVLVATTFAVVVVIVFLLPVWDSHVDGWSGDYHGHNYYERGMHFH